MAENDGAAAKPAGTHDAPDGYEDLTRIDQGGFATVYRARDTRFDRTVALKILRSDSLNERQLRRFNAECLATGRVSSHPNIVTVYDAGTTRGHRPWLAMEYCSGGSLAQKVAAQGPLDVAEVISIGARLGSALSAAHQAGILHRDVKPHNVLLTSYGEPALADFGIASVVIEDGTVTETAAYTVVHAAPEILEGRAGTAAADIYSLGSTLYTLLAGRAPFATEAGIGLAPLVTRILHNDLPVIARPGVPPELERLLCRCMAAHPQDRPASAADLSASLAELGSRLGVPPAHLGQRLAAGAFAPRPQPLGAFPVDDQALLVTRRRDDQGSEPQLLPATPAATPAAPTPDTPTPVPPTPVPPTPVTPAPRAPTPVTPNPPAATPAPPPPAAPTPVSPAAPTPSAPISARRLLVILGGTLGIFLAAFTVWGLTHRGAGQDPLSPSMVAARAAPAAAKYLPRNVVVAQGPELGELVVSWSMPVRPDVVATVIYEGVGAKARAIVNYDANPQAAPQATLRGLPSGRQVCLSTAHLVSLDDRVTNALGSPVCALPR